MGIALEQADPRREYRLYRVDEAWAFVAALDERGGFMLILVISTCRGFPRTRRCRS